MTNGTPVFISEHKRAALAIFSGMEKSGYTASDIADIISHIMALHRIRMENEIRSLKG